MNTEATKTDCRVILKQIMACKQLLEECQGHFDPGDIQSCQELLVRYELLLVEAANMDRAQQSDSIQEVKGAVEEIHSELRAFVANLPGGG